MFALKVDNQLLFLFFFWSILQEIISEEIVDETDRYEDNQHRKRAKRVTTASIMRGWVLEYGYGLTKLVNLDLFFFLSFFLFFFSIVERERRKDSVSLLWPEPRSPSSDNANTPNVHTPLKEGGSGNVFFSVPRQGSWDPGRFGEYSLYLFFSFFFFFLGITEANDVCIYHRTPKLSHDCTYFLVGFIIVYSSFPFFFFFFLFFFLKNTQCMYCCI